MESAPRDLEAAESAAAGSAGRTVERLEAEIATLRGREEALFAYIRDKVNQLLGVMGTVPLKPEELDEETLLALDPIGIVALSFSQVLDHLRETNDELETARDEIRAILDSAGAGILVLDEELRIIDYNRRMWSSFFAASGMEVIGRPCRDVLCAGEADSGRCGLGELLASSGDSYRGEWTCGGRHFAVHGTATTGAVAGRHRWVVSFTDITDRMNVEQALQVSEERYRDLFENASDLIQSVLPDGRFLYVNRAWMETLGYDEEDLAQLTVFDIIHPDTREKCTGAFQRLLRDHRPEKVEGAFLTKDGRRVEVEANLTVRLEDGQPVSTRAIIRDVTQQRRLAAEILRTEKLESLGVLAGGIAHDFNNLLTAIAGNISLARLEDTGPEARLRLLSEAEKATFKARTLTQQLLTFARGGAPVKRAESIAQLVRESTGFALSGSTTLCHLSVPDDLWAVRVDAGQIGQVIHNLVLNAAQAMPAGGEVEVRCANVEVDAAHTVPLAAGRYVAISVDDRGDGIAPEILDRIFDPFFTTKKGGTGLGLATCHSIVRRHEGHIEVDSRPGSGTSFRVYLPASPLDKATDSAEEDAVVYGQGRVLVMDDEEMVRRVATVMLESLGYRVEAASDGAQAVELFRQAREAGDGYDALLMDLTVPGGMGGREAVREILEIDSQARAIVSSGYANDPIMADFESYGFRGVISKPYSVEGLSATLSQVLSGSAPEPPLDS